MKADPNYDGIGPGPNPEPTPGECPHDGAGMEVSKRVNANTEAFITTFHYTCPKCDRTYIDRP